MRGSQREIDDPQLTAKTWSGWLSEGCDYDSWGQPVEAVAVYSRLKNSIDECIAAGRPGVAQQSWSIDERQERCVDKKLLSVFSAFDCRELVATYVGAEAIIESRIRKDY